MLFKMRLMRNKKSLGIKVLTWVRRIGFNPSTFTSMKDLIILNKTRMKERQLQTERLSWKCKHSILSMKSLNLNGVPKRPITIFMSLNNLRNTYWTAQDLILQRLRSFWTKGLWLKSQTNHQGASLKMSRRTIRIVLIRGLTKIQFQKII